MPAKATTIMATIEGPYPDVTEEEKAQLESYYACNPGHPKAFYGEWAGKTFSKPVTLAQKQTWEAHQCPWFLRKKRNRNYSNTEGSAWCSVNHERRCKYAPAGLSGMHLIGSATGSKRQVESCEDEEIEEPPTKVQRYDTGAPVVPSMEISDLMVPATPEFSPIPSPPPNAPTTPALARSRSTQSPPNAPTTPALVQSGSTQSPPHANIVDNMPSSEESDLLFSDTMRQFTQQLTQMHFRREEHLNNSQAKCAELQKTLTKINDENLEKDRVIARLEKEAREKQRGAIEQQQVLMAKNKEIKEKTAMVERLEKELAEQKESSLALDVKIAELESCAKASAHAISTQNMESVAKSNLIEEKRVKIVRLEAMLQKLLVRKEVQAKIAEAEIREKVLVRCENTKRIEEMENAAVKTAERAKVERPERMEQLEKVERRVKDSETALYNLHVDAGEMNTVLDKVIAELKTVEELLQRQIERVETFEKGVEEKLFKERQTAEDRIRQLEADLQAAIEKTENADRNSSKHCLKIQNLKASLRSAHRQKRVLRHIVAIIGNFYNNSQSAVSTVRSENDDLKAQIIDYQACVDAQTVELDKRDRFRRLVQAFKEISEEDSLVIPGFSGIGVCYALFQATSSAHADTSDQPQQ